LTNEHVAWTQHNFNLSHFNPLDRTSLAINRGGDPDARGVHGSEIPNYIATIDAAFVPFADPSRWNPTAYARTSRETYTNIRLGNESQIIDGKLIRQVGFATGSTPGTITRRNTTVSSYNAEFSLFTTRNNVFRHNAETAGGDSGGPVYFVDEESDTLYLIGLHFTGRKTLFGNFYGHACRISEVIRILDVTPITNDTPLGLTIEDNVVTGYVPRPSFNGHINVPEGVIAIGSGAFKNQNSITSVTLPRSLRTIDNQAFEGCINLQSVRFAPNSELQTIGNNAFRDCWRLSDFEIPMGVREIGHDAFQHTRLTHITIPGSVTYIGARAFRHSQLRTVYILRPSSEIAFTGTVAGGSQIFDGNHHQLTIRFPDCISLRAYSTAFGWREFSDRMWSNTYLNQIHLELNQTRNIAQDLVSGRREYTFFNDSPRFVQITLSGTVMPWDRMIVVRNGNRHQIEVLDGMGMAESSMFSTQVTVFLPSIGNFFIDVNHLSGFNQIFLRIEEAQKHQVDFSPSAPLRLNIFRGVYGSEMHRVVLTQNARFNVSIPNTLGLIFIIYRFDGVGFDFSQSHWFFNGGNDTVTLPAGIYYMGYFNAPRGWSGNINITRINVPLMFSMSLISTEINHNALTDEDFEILRIILNKDLREQDERI